MEASGLEISLLKFPGKCFQIVNILKYWKVLK